MTKREFYNAIVAAGLNEEITEYAREAIEGMDRTNEKRRETQAKKAAAKFEEKAPLREALFACVTDEPKTATMLIAEAGLELKPQSVPSLMKGFVTDGTVAKASVKVKGKGTQVGYVRV